MFDFIDKLRAKPEKEKRKFAFMFSGVITSIIFMIWIFTVVHTASNLAPLPDDSRGPSPFAQIGGSFSKVFESMSNIFKQSDVLVPPAEYSSTTSQ
jgi:hypothetical protein